MNDGTGKTKVFRMRMSVAPSPSFFCKPVRNPPYVDIHMVSASGQEYALQVRDFESDIVQALFC